MVQRRRFVPFVALVSGVNEKKMTKRLLTILLPIPLAVGIAALMAQTAPGYRAYEIRMVTTMTSDTLSPASGGRTLSNIYFARDDGSRGARTVEVIDGRSCTSTVYWDAKTDLKVSFDECTGMKSTEPFTFLPSFPGKARQTCKESIRQSFEGVEVLHGLRVEKYREEGPAAAGATYYAPELGCLKVRGVYYWKNPAGKTWGTTFDEPVEVKLDTCDARFFQNPEAYNEVLPSVRRNALDMFFRGDSQPAACLRRMNEIADAKYLAARSKGRRQDLWASVRDRSEAAADRLVDKLRQRRSKPDSSVSSR